MASVRRWVRVGSMAALSAILTAGCGRTPSASRKTTTTTAATTPTTTASPTATTTTQPLPGVVANCDAPGNAANDTTARPPSIIVACGSTPLTFQDLSWASWTMSSAAGAGQLSEDDCTPDCAGGTFHQYEASVTLKTVVASINGPVLSVIDAKYPDGAPDGEATGTFSLPVPPPPSPTCSASQLQGSVSGPGVSGDFSEEFVGFTNMSSQGCHMEGFPGFDLLNSSGTSIINASRGCPWAPAGWCPTALDYIYLRPDDGSASFGLVWQSTAEPGQTCMESASALVTPPNAFDHLTLSLEIAVCGEPLQLGVGTVGY